MEEVSDIHFSSAAVADEDEWFDPAQSEMELSDLLGSLGAEHDEKLNIKYAPSNNYQDEFSILRDEVDAFGQSSYLKEFDHVVRDDIIMVGSMSKEELEAHEQMMRRQEIDQQLKQMQVERDRKENLERLAESAKRRVWLDSKQQEKDAAMRDELLKKRENLLTEQMKKAFRLSESQLRRTLQVRQGEVKAFYGDLELADNQFGGSKGRRWRVEWTKTPQPIQIKLQTIRGIRDKAPAGRYVIMLSLYDRLGGHPLRWSKLAGQQWGGATLPVKHDGKFTSSEMKIDQSVFTVVPPQRSVEPGMILTFEVFLLRGGITPTDKVVAWGCFPICDGQFNIIQGYYKLPLLRGHMDKRITKHSTIERLMASDIDHWIANLYIQIYRLPRYLSGQKEYEVELQFSSALLSFPDRLATSELAADGEKLPENDHDAVDDDTASSLSIDATVMDLSSSGKRESSVKWESSDKSSVVRKRGGKSLKDEEVKPVPKEKEDKMIPVEGQAGMYYHLHDSNPVEDYEQERKRQTTTLLPRTPILNKTMVRPTLTHSEDLDRHTFSVQPAFSSKGRLRQHGYERAEYVGRMFLSEMGFAQWTTHDFWITILLLIVIWFCRLYIHYCGQWILLQALSLPVSSFVFFPYTVNLNYQSDLLTTAEELGVVLLGPVANIIIQILLVLISWICQIVLGTFPLLFSKFIMAFSLWTVLDPIVILIVDSAIGRYVNSPSQPIGDAFKLYYHFLRVEGSGIVGIPLTIFLYLLVIFVALVILYLYFLKLHNNGRILDVYHRLHGNNDAFLPYDLELSNQELSDIVRRAEQWRGEDGERRKVAVYDYIWEEDDWDGAREVTTHIAIHTLHLDGLRELYRHFLRLPDGAVVEVFGELGSTGLAPDVKTALLKRSNVLESVVAGDSEEKSLLMETTHDGDSSKQFLSPPTEFKDRPLTTESMRTRETFRRESTDSSTDMGPTIDISSSQA